MNYPSKSTRPKSFAGDVKTTTSTTVYTCPQNCTAELSFLHVVNVSGNNTVRVYWYLAATGYSSNFLGGKNMSAAEYITFSPMQLFLSPGDQIRVVTDVAGHLDIIGSVIETFIPVG